MTIIDVRVFEEYQLGHLQKSVNIPLREIRNSLNKIRSFSKPIVVCCTTGNKSQLAADYLRNHGVACVNGGSLEKMINDYYDWF